MLYSSGASAEGTVGQTALPKLQLSVAWVYTPPASSQVLSTRDLTATMDLRRRRRRRRVSSGAGAVVPAWG
jgi:hypothetical protein